MLYNSYHIIKVPNYIKEFNYYFNNYKDYEELYNRFAMTIANIIIKDKGLIALFLKSKK